MGDFADELGRVLRYSVDAERAAFEKSIDDNPLDATNHLVYADWLQDHGEDEEAEFRRAMGEWVRRGPDDFRGPDGKHLATGSFRDYSREAQKEIGRGEGTHSIREGNLPEWGKDTVVHTSDRQFDRNPVTAHRVGSRYYWDGYRHMESALRQAFQTSRTSPPSAG